MMLKNWVQMALDTAGQAFRKNKNKNKNKNSEDKKTDSLTLT